MLRAPLWGKTQDLYTNAPLTIIAPMPCRFKHTGRLSRSQQKRIKLSVTLSGSGAGHPLRRSWFGRGFTLLELLVVIAIIGLLASYVGPRFFGQVAKSEIKLAQAQIDAFSKALDAYRLDVGRYPTTEQSLKALTQRPEGLDKWSGPYLQQNVPADPWGRPYVYRAPGDEGRDYEIVSLGKDGAPGGDAENADVRSWR